MLTSKNVRRYFPYHCQLFGVRETLRILRKHTEKCPVHLHVADAFVEWWIWYRRKYLMSSYIRTRYFRGVIDMRKPEKQTKKEDTGKSMRDEAFTKKYPQLTEYLVSSQYDDGSARETASLSLYTQDGSWGVSLNDRDNQRSLYCVATTLPEAFAALEKHCGADSADWRP